MEADSEDFEKGGIWKNGPGVRYASSSRSSQRFDSPLCTPVSRPNEDETDTIPENGSITLPSLIQDRSQAQEVPQKKAKKKKKVKTFSLDDDRDLEKKRQKETEKFLQIYKDLHKIRDYFYDEYMVALRKKITQQQKEIKEKDAVRERIRQGKLRQEKMLTHQVQKRLERHEFTHDDSFLKKIPKTQLFKIVQLEDKLRKSGTLKYNCEVDEFWTAIRKNPTVFNYYLEKLNTDRGTQSLFRKRLNSAQKKALDKLGEEWSQLSENATPQSSSGHRDSWAVTHMYPHQQKHSSTRSSRRSSLVSPSKQAASDLEKRCPKMEMPDLYCFKMDLSRKLPDPLEMLQGAEIQAKDHERKKYLRKLHKMHQMAITHQAVSDRILQSHLGDLDMMYGGPDINDVIDVKFAIGQSGSVPEDTAPFEGGCSSEDVAGNLALAPNTSSLSLKDNPEDHKEDAIVLEDEEKPAALPASKKLIPLSLEQVKNSCKIVEAQCSSVYWNNYLQASKPVAT